MTATETPSASPTLDTAEIERFQRMAKAWWDPTGKFRPLHQIGPARLTFVRDEIVRHFGLDAKSAAPFTGLKVIDIGCGGGLISEPLCRLGAKVTGIDPGKMNIDIAKGHAEPQGLAIDYRVSTIEDVAAAGNLFDAVVCLEVVEHVPDVAQFLKTCASVLRPGGLMLLSTINRNMKSYALAIVAAEYVLNWLPRGTHQWDRFITPDELAAHLAAADMTPPTFAGFTYNPFRDEWTLGSDTSVNYLAASAKPAV